MVSGGGGITPDYKIKLDLPPNFKCRLETRLFFNFVQKKKNKYNNFMEVVNDDSLMVNFEKYIEASDIEVFMKGESNYLDMKELLFNLDSNSVQITGAIDILDSILSKKH